MNVLLIKKPYDINLSGNPIIYVFAVFPYTAVQLNQDIKLQVKVLVEEVANSGAFIVARSQVFIPDSDGKITVDVANIVNAYIDFYTPKLSLNKPLALTSHKVKFKINYSLIANGNIAVAATDSPQSLALKGGLAKEHFHPLSFFVDVIGNQKKSLNFCLNTEKIMPWQNKLMLWLCNQSNSTNQSIVFTVFFEDDSSADYVLPDTVPSNEWGVCLAPVGMNVVNSLLPVNNTLLVQAYRVKVKIGNTIIVDSGLIKVDYRALYDYLTLYYRNSFGALENIVLRGQADFETEYEREQAERAMPPIWFNNNVLIGGALQSHIYERQKITAATGFISKETAENLRDLLLTNEAYIEENNKLIPIIIEAKNSKFFSNKDSLIAMQIEFTKAVNNEFYTPNKLIQLAMACPAVESLQVRQLNKNTLLILFALQAPYNTIKVEIIIGSTTNTYFFNGNNGAVKQSFVNPATGGSTANITVKGYTVCDADSSPESIGPVTILNITVNGSSALIAQNDSYQINNGFNTAIALNGSVLANDSDPDGNAIEAVANTGNTTANGSFAIVANGTITYTPPSSNFTGADSFTYQIQRVGTTNPRATASVTIMVGANATNVYVVVVERNQNGFGTGDGSAFYTADAYLEFYSNPLGTIPLDLTNSGIQINIEQRRERIDANGNSTVDSIASVVTATGVAMYIGGVSIEDIYDQTNGTNTRDETKWFARPGTGYIVL